jgi:hypothetical protein
MPRAATLIGLIALVASPALLAAQTSSSPPADLSGDWAPDNRPGRGGIGQSLSAADPAGRMRGKEPDIPYLPWALEKTMSEVPPTGPDAKFEANTDPQIHYCEPPGPAHIFMYPAKTRFVQTPEAVYILHEVGPVFRVVWLNSKHPEDPDPQYWGHSIGWYENGDTLVVDTVGVNDRTWLDQVGHPHTEQLPLTIRARTPSRGPAIATSCGRAPASCATSGCARCATTTRITRRWANPATTARPRSNEVPSSKFQVIK